MKKPRAPTKTFENESGVDYRGPMHEAVLILSRGR